MISLFCWLWTLLIEIETCGSKPSPTKAPSRSLDPAQHIGALPSSNRKLIEVEILEQGKQIDVITWTQVAFDLPKGDPVFVLAAILGMVDPVRLHGDLSMYRILSAKKVRLLSVRNLRGISFWWAPRWPSMIDR